MARRTNTGAVETLLGGNYGELPDGTRPSLTPYVDSANAVVSRVQACATRKGVTLTAAELELLERWLAAHYYTKMDPTYSSESTDRASGAYVRDPETPEPYLSGAISIDPSGCLKAMMKGRRASAAWLGKTPSEAIPYVDRS